jgi:hypothetical protein
MSIDSRDHNAPYNREQLPKLTREEEQKNNSIVKKYDIVHILESYSESNPRYTIIKLKKLLEL